jgi:carbonic anhydrase
MKTFRHIVPLIVASALILIAALAQAAGPGVSPDQALSQLTAGNKRFVSGQVTHPNQSAARRAELANTQHPVAVVIGCSDSRVSPEIVFDEGIGDLFVIRTAGNRLDDLGLASVEYAVDHLGCTLVVVMGHERCGAVTAAIDAAKASAPEHDAAGSHIPVLVHELQDAVAKAKDEPGDQLDNTVVENVRIVTADLPVRSPLLAAGIKAGTLKVVGMRYDLDTGVVSPVDSAPVAAAPKKK